MSIRGRVHALAIEAEIDRDSIANLCDIARFLTDWLVEHGERLKAIEDELSQPLVDDLTPEAALRSAIARQAVVTFKYRDAEGQSSYRVVSPYEIEHKRTRDLPGTNYYSLVAWDHGREAPRHFRIERIEGPVTCTSVEAYREPQD